MSGTTSFAGPAAHGGTVKERRQLRAAGLQGPGPVVSTDRKPDGTMNVFGAWAGDHTNPILKPEAAEAVRKRGELCP